MFKLKMLTSVLIISFLLVATSIIKNETRKLEKEIFTFEKKIFQKSKDLNESELDFSYLTSPSMIEKKIEYLDRTNYKVMEYSKIFLSISNFVEIENKYATKQNDNERKRINKDYQTNQTSFYFDDYLETNKKKIVL